MSREDDWAKGLIRERFGVSHETFDRLETYVGHLEHWQKRINLVAPSTLQDIWTRHILDSVQLFGIKPGVKRWLDLGSGGGLPGLVLGALLVEVPGGQIVLVESNGKKGAFLRHVAADLQLPVTVYVDRIERVVPSLNVPEVVTARALASLDMLLGFSNLLLKRGAIGLFPKGKDYADELTVAHKNWHFSDQQHVSVTESSSRILEISMTSPAF